jgi:hypothetical protein
MRPDTTLNGAASNSARRRGQLSPGLLRAREAAEWCSVSLRVWRSWDSSGVCPSPVMRTRGIVLWSLKTLRLWRDFGCPTRKEFEALLAAHNGQQR